MLDRPKSTISTNLILVMMASLGVVIDKFELDDQGNPFHLSFSYPSTSEKKDNDGNVLEGAFLGAKISELARRMFPSPVTVEVFEREDDWTEERSAFARKFLIQSIIQQGQDFNSYIFQW